MFTHLWTGLAGGSSVFMGLWGTLFAPNTNAKVLLCITAVIAFFWASFLVWFKEHEAYLKESEAKSAADKAHISAVDALAEYAARFNALEIEFDPTNTNRDFWSFESIEEGFGHVISCVEYRVRIKNNSNKTVRNVRVFIRLIGITPHKPVLSIFSSTRQTVSDIGPHHSLLAPIFHRTTQPRAGDLAGETANAAGPVEVQVTGDDVQTVRRLFYIDVSKEPVIRTDDL